jgi:NAD(P)-dependent dehydrogenase (short-subunit alcohol dehydrogenase family)
MARTWLVTGCSSGFGKRTAAAVAARGDNLVATARTVGGVEELAGSYPTTRTRPLR